MAECVLRRTACTQVAASDLRSRQALPTSGLATSVVWIRAICRKLYLQTLMAAAEHSGGGLIAAVPRVVHDCPDHEDNLILDLAAEVGALIVVSGDNDLLSMSPWRGTPIIEPRTLAAKVGAMRRHARRPHR
jgi:hypothetical protein